MVDVSAGDFGIAKRLTATMESASTFVGTPCCLAPEMCQDIPYTSKADVWVYQRSFVVSVQTAFSLKVKTLLATA